MNAITPPPFDQPPKIRSIEIRPGTIETYRVTMEAGGVMILDAAMLNDFRIFSRESISQIRRKFPPMKEDMWSLEVDRALRTAIEPAAPEEEQLRFHGEPNWGSEDKPWLVRERLPEQGFGLISGRYSTFKSFVMLDLCGSVMPGLPFLKARTLRRGGVLIFAAEGASDVPVRMKALVKHRLTNEISPDLFAERQINLDRLPICYADKCRPLLNPKTVDWMIAKAREAQEFFQRQYRLDLVLVGIDTLSAAAGWDNENDAAQAQIVMNALRDLSVATNTCVIAVDHFGKDISAGTRGSIVKESSADFILSTLGEINPDTNVVTDSRLVLRKLRSGPQGAVFPFNAKVVEMGTDRWGEPQTSRVVDWAVERPTQRRARTQAQSTLEQALSETFADHTERVVVDGREREAVSYANLQMAFRRISLQRKPDLSNDAISMALKRARERMQDRLTEGPANGGRYVWYPDGVI